MGIVLICGDRNWDDYKKILKTLKEEDAKDPIMYVIEGGQRTRLISQKRYYGADYQGKKAAQALGIQTIECEALWEYFGKKAGAIRNDKQLNIGLALCSALAPAGEAFRFFLVLAFHSDLKNSKGTKDMVNRAKRNGVKVKVIE
jgi:SLOG family YspA-like protein